MNGEEARAGLAYVMRETDAQRWDETPEGYVITVRWRKRENRRYLVPRNVVEGCERDLNNEIPPLRIRLEDFRRIG